MDSPIEAALRRHRALTIAALALLSAMAWFWLLAGAGMDMDPMASLAPLPASGGSMPDMAGMAGGMAGMEMAPPGSWPASRLLLVFSMWWVMMVAMMIPSAAPTILLYSRAAPNPGDGAKPATASFLLGYLVAWAAFSFLATSAHWQLERAGWLAPATMASQSRWLSAAILIAAGVYQLSPLKDVCLRHCRNPAQFLSLHYRPGAAGALRMGLLHGTYCVGCCWLLMTLLFVGGVMNLAWIALLTLMVAAEKLLPFGRAVAIASGAAFLAWAALMLLG